MCSLSITDNSLPSRLQPQARLCFSATEVKVVSSRIYMTQIILCQHELKRTCHGLVRGSPFVQFKLFNEGTMTGLLAWMPKAPFNECWNFMCHRATEAWRVKYIFSNIWWAGHVSLSYLLVKSIIHWSVLLFQNTFYFEGEWDALWVIGGNWWQQREGPWKFQTKEKQEEMVLVGVWKRKQKWWRWQANTSVL